MKEVNSAESHRGEAAHQSSYELVSSVRVSVDLPLVVQTKVKAHPAEDDYSSSTSKSPSPTVSPGWQWTLFTWGMRPHDTVSINISVPMILACIFRAAVR